MSYFIKSVDWIITNRCNSHCKICDIWRFSKDDRKKELSIEDIEKILKCNILHRSSRFYNRRFDIALGGGEPFLRQNLKEISLMINQYYPNSIGAISTNGLLRKKIIEFLDGTYSIFKTKLNISLDGNEKNHDLQRGCKGAYKKTLTTVNSIKEKFPKQKIELKMTLTPANHTDILYVYNLARKLNCDFSFKPAEYMKNYINRLRRINFKFSEEQIKIIKEQADDIFLRELKKGRRKEALFYKHIPCYLKDRNARLVRCDIAKNSITIMPDGNVYSCILMPSIGDLKKQSIDNIWNSKKIKRQREKIDEGKCPNCMLKCGIFKSFGKL